MALAAPDYFSGAGDPQKAAHVLFSHAGWMRRRCNEILSEAELDVVKIYDLASHCNLYRTEVGKWLVAGEVTGILEALSKHISEAGVGRPSLTTDQVKTEAKAVYDAAGVFLTWATANLPGAGAPVLLPTVTVNRAVGQPPDFTVRVTKAAAVQNQVQTLRNAFA